MLITGCVLSQTWNLFLLVVSRQKRRCHLKLFPLRRYKWCVIFRGGGIRSVLSTALLASSAFVMVAAFV